MRLRIDENNKDLIIRVANSLNVTHPIALNLILSKLSVQNAESIVNIRISGKNKEKR